MKRNTNLRKAASASLALLIFASPIGHAMENDLLPSPVPSRERLRDHGYYKQELQKLEKSTTWIHEEVDRILAEFRKNIEEYRKHTRGTGTAVITADQEEVERKAREEAEQEAAAKKEAAEEEAVKVVVRENLQKLLNREPRVYEIFIGEKLARLLGHQPTANEFSIGQEYPISNNTSKEFIAAAVYLKYELGISNATIPLIKATEELMKEKNEPTLKDLNKKLKTELFSVEPTAEEHAELERQKLNLRLEQLEKRNQRDYQKKILKPKATEEQIKEGLRLGGKATQEQAEASMSASKILREEKNKGVHIREQLNSLDEVNAWIYLRDTLKKDMNNPDFLMKATHSYIPKIIALKNQGTPEPKWEEISPSPNPSLKRKLKKILVEEGKWEKQKSILVSDATEEQIKEGLRLGGEATQKQIEASMSASEILQKEFSKKYKLKNLDEVNAWIYLRDTLKKDMNNPEFVKKAIRRYIPKIMALKNKGTLEPKWKQINPLPILGPKTTQEQIDKIFNDLDKIEEVNAWIYLRDTLEKDMNNPEFVNKAMQSYIPKIIELKNQGTSEPTWEEITPSLTK